MELDTRLVQTAVLGNTDSHDPAIMPMTRFEAKRFLDDLPGTSFWCGTWLGGCGRQLMTRVGMERIPHFAHRPKRDGVRAACHRLHRDRRSADHLFVSRDLSTWAREQGHTLAMPVLDGDFRLGGTCTCVQIPLRGGTGGGLITVVFKGFDLSDWHNREVAEFTQVSWFNWVFGPGMVSPQALLERDGYALHLRLDSTNAGGIIEIGTRPRKGNTEWVGLEECAVEEHGISTPLASEIRIAMRRKRTVLPPTESRPATQVRVAGVNVALPRFRRVLLRIGQEYAMAGEMERASQCAHLGKTTDLESPRLPPWVWLDIKRHLGIPAMTTTTLPDGTRRGGGRPSAPPPTQLDDVLDAIPLDQRLVDFLAETGCSVYDDVDRMRWLRLATTHVSFLHEYGLTEVVDPSVLRGLAGLAKRHVQTAVLDRYLRDHQPQKVGQQSTDLNARENHAWEALTTLPLFEDAMHFGTGEAVQVREHHSKSPGVVARQIVGVAALLGGHDAVRRLVDRAVDNAQTSTAAEPAIDWQTKLNNAVRGGELERKQERTGPDHDPTFTMKLTDARGRKAEGSGPSRKAARHEASVAFLRRWMPHLLADNDTDHGRREAPRMYQHAPRTHRTAIDDLIAQFELPQGFAPCLAQALTHKSWVYENRDETRRASQRDNTALAHQGSVVAGLLMAHHRVQAVLSRTAAPEPGELTTLTPEEEIWRELFARMRLHRGLMLGSGQRSNPEPTFAGAMQAVLAVAWRAHGSRLLSTPPTILDEWIRTNGPVQDAATRLQRTCSIFGIIVEADFLQRGPDHRSEFAATITLREGQEWLTVVGDWTTGGKPSAKKRCAERVLGVFLEIARYDEWDLSAEGRRIAAFLLRAQLRNATQVKQRDLVWCCLQGHLGTSYLLAGDHEAYEAWSRRVEELINERPTESDPRLVDYYLHVLEADR